MIIDREFAADGHIFRLAVEKAANGWDVQERCDSTVVHVEHHDDWQRVECAMQLLEFEALRHDRVKRRPRRRLSGNPTTT